MIIIIYNYTKPLAEVDAIRQAHIDHYEKYRQNGDMVCGGRLTTETGGTCILRNISRSEAEAHVNTDPYVTEQVATADVLEFEPTYYCSELTA